VLYHYGLTEFKYYTVIFGVSRALGALTQLVWARAFGLPIERPKCASSPSPSPSAAHLIAPRPAAVSMAELRKTL
jgi:hypothetical protein